MRPKSLKYLLTISIMCLLTKTEAQRIDNSTWKAQIALGISLPSSTGFIDVAPSQSVNFPAVNLGVQRMFSRTLGAKLDYGFNRFVSDDTSTEFKINYSRVNAQLVYDPSQYLLFLPEHFQTVLHGGPGFSFATPLGTLGDNKQSYLNFNFGVEVHYSISRTLAVFTDVSYIYGFTSLEDYNPQLSGLGAFNGNVLNLTFGISISLSDCFYCE